MDILQRLRQMVERFLSASAEEAPRWRRFGLWEWRLWGRSITHLHRHNVGAMSSALSFRSILAMVPALVLAFLVLRSVGIIGQPQQVVRRVLETAGFEQIYVVQEQPVEATTQGESAEINVARRLEQLVANVEGKLTLGVLGPVGVVLLIWTSLSLLNTMESSFNRIFEAPQSRSFWRRVLTYWSVMTLGPVMLATASYIANQAGSAAGRLIERLPGAAAALGVASHASGLIFGIILVVLLYKLMPNASVSLRAALGGAIVAVPLWLLAKWAFGLYVREVVGRGSLYGTLGVIPLFLLWLNLSWQIVLLGAQLAYTQENLVRLESSELAERTHLGPADHLVAALAVCRRFEKMGGPMPAEQLAQELSLPLESVHKVCRLLQSLEVVRCIGEDADEAVITLQGPMSKITVAKLVGLEQPLRPGADAELKAIYNRLVQQASTRLHGLELEDLMSPPVR